MRSSKRLVHVYASHLASTDHQILARRSAFHRQDSVSQSEYRGRYFLVGHVMAEGVR